MKRHLFTYCLLILLCSCSKSTEEASTTSTSPFFRLLEQEECGIQFSNDLKATVELNVFNYMYFYNGGGLGAGDFNNDGQIDLFFSGNQVENALYINKGNFQFQDVSKTANINIGKGWANGVSVIDINNDGKLDIYVSQIGNFEILQNTNRLYICTEINAEGIPIYEEKAAEYGLDLVGFGTQGVFFDYDVDGDLDFFQLNHSIHANGTFGQRASFMEKSHPLAGDRLFKNVEGKYIEVTQESGIFSTAIGYGLGVVASDINLDGYPDLYVCNDFHENDYLYINQGDGTFKEEIESRIKHTSRFSMGVDIADISGDAYPEIFTLDMHPEDPYILKKSEGEDTYDTFKFKLGFGYNHQYARNMLQLNRGDATFSEIARYSDVYASEWSWATLIFDFEGDGQNDIFVSNGIPKRMNDMDYINFAIDDEVQAKLTFNLEESDLKLTDKLPEIKIENKFYQNTGSNKFEDKSKRVNNVKGSFSNSAIYADFDLDGDLDIATNNVQQAGFIYENQAKDSTRFFNIRLKGSKNNLQAIGSKIIVFAKDQRKVIEKIPVRGFQSSMEIPMNLALSPSLQSNLDSIILVWPDNTFMRLTDLQNRNQTLTYQEGLPKFDYNVLKIKKQYSLEDLTADSGFKFKHKENPFIDFNRESLMPNMISSEGPALAVGDVDGNGLEDVFVGNSKREAAALFLQVAENRFEAKEVEVFEKDKLAEDVQALFMYVNQDGHLDLIVGSGGNEFRETSDAMLTRAYLNDGEGDFTKADAVLPKVVVNVGALVKGDLNKDGFEDLVIGGRAVPWKYGDIPQSHILINTGQGSFEDKTQDFAPDFAAVGMVQDLQLVDINGDECLDIVCGMEWEVITAFVNQGGKSLKKKALTKEKGWWTSIIPVDFDQDGDMDFFLGNLGENSKLKVGEEQTVKMYYYDFDDNDKKDQVLTYFVKGREIPFATKMELDKQMPFLKKKFLYADDFAKASLKDLFSADKLQKAKVFTADFFRNALLENRGDEGFVLQSLPDAAQLTPYYTGMVCDLNEDELPDLILGGNFYDNNIQMGRMDADLGTILLNKGDFGFEVISLNNQVFGGQVKNIVPLEGKNKNTFISTINNDSLRLFHLKSKAILQ